jgi:hypothetical protein
MLMADYAASFFIIRSLDIYNVSPNLDTYQIVIKSLQITLEEVPDSENLDDADDLISQMPSLSLIMGQESPTEPVGYSSTPLQRILRRALLAQIKYSFKSDISNLSPSQLVSNIITHAKKLMNRDVPAWVQRTKPPSSDDKRIHRSRKYARPIKL